MGGWVGEPCIHRKTEVNEAVRMRYWSLWVGGWWVVYLPTFHGEVSPCLKDLDDAGVGGRPANA